MQTLEFIYPDDWHCHLRDGAYLATTVPAAAKQFKRVVVMPNLVPPVTTASRAQEYFAAIQAHIPVDRSFQPLMTLYLMDETTPAIISQAKKSDCVIGCKLYPAGVTTHSQAGVNQIEKLYPIFAAMENHHLPLLIHGEVNDPNVDIFDRERVFIEKHLDRLINTFSGLKIVLEHITTQEAVHFVKQGPATLAATITPHHLLLNRNDLLAGGIKPHHYCLPILKRQTHQQALLTAATSGNPKFFIGTDSAPHVQSKKESACGCAGIYNGFAAIEMYAQVFESVQCLDKLEGFVSRFGPDFYGLPYNRERIRLVKKNWTVPKQMAFGTENLIPFMADQALSWQQISDYD